MFQSGSSLLPASLPIRSLSTKGGPQHFTLNAEAAELFLHTTQNVPPLSPCAQVRQLYDTRQELQRTTAALANEQVRLWRDTLLFHMTRLGVMPSLSHSWLSSCSDEASGMQMYWSSVGVAYQVWHAVVVRLPHVLCPAERETCSAFELHPGPAGRHNR